MDIFGKLDQIPSRHYSDITFTRMRLLKVTVILTFDLRPPKFNHFISESKWTFVPSPKKFCQCFSDIVFTVIGWIDGQIKNIKPPAMVTASVEA